MTMHGLPAEAVAAGSCGPTVDLNHARPAQGPDQCCAAPAGFPFTRLCMPAHDKTLVYQPLSEAGTAGRYGAEHHDEAALLACLSSKWAREQR